ncbi:MAG: ATP-binding protein [Nitrosopumilus sp.]|nr:ATP-binding protein [Nitrosopumilus sp.]MDA7998522.1 ATP-binding protein [Nitrosopumilus sp.]
MEIDIFSALMDFLDVYDSHAEMVVTEAVANALDAGATRVEITLKNSAEGKKTIAFYNNGPSMTRTQFDNYHVISRSSKSKGTGIGFAGIGAKVYLAAWDGTTIHTETTDGKTSFASNMWSENRILKADTDIRPTLKRTGTLYSVHLKTDDYNYLDKMLEDIVSDTFTPALEKNVTITVNGKKIKPWSPKYQFKKSTSVMSLKKKFPIILRVTEEDISDDKQNIQYHVLGKVINTKKPDWLYDVRPRFQKQIHVYVDCLNVSDHLKLDKTKFKKPANKYFKEIDRMIYNILLKENYINKDPEDKTKRTNFTKFLDKLFKNPKYAFLNPGAVGGRGPGRGKGSGGDGGSTTGGKNGKKRGSSGDSSRGGGSLKITYHSNADDVREGWMDAGNNSIVINMAHPLFLQVESNTLARNQKLGAIITSELIKNASTKQSMDPDEAFRLQTDILTMAKDVEWDG